jgi:hypothetical protein
MSIPALLIQVAISIIVVTLYHLWMSGKKQSGPTLPVVVAPVAPPPKPSPVVEPMPPELLAVIAAAIAVVLGQPHRVVSVQQAAGHTPEVNVWALEGRVEQFLSHKIR